MVSFYQKCWALIRGSLEKDRACLGASPLNVSQNSSRDFRTKTEFSDFLFGKMAWALDFWAGIEYLSSGIAIA